MNNNGIIKLFLSSSLTDKNLSRRTIKAYKFDLLHFNKYFEIENISKIDTYKIREYLKYLQESNYKPRSIKRKIATIKVFYTFLENEDIIGYSPTHKLKGKFKIPKSLPKVLSYLEIKKILLIATNEINNSKFSSLKSKYQKLRNKIIIELLFCTGMRIDEVTKLDVHDIDVFSKTVIVKGKGNKERLIYISNREVINILRQYFELRSQLQATSKSLLLNNQLKRLSVYSIGNIFNNIIRKCNFEKHYTPHCLRHTMATMLVENGADIRSVQEILGHNSISTTEIYVAVSRKRKKEVMEKFNGRNKIYSL